MQTRLDMLPGDFLGAKSPCTRRGHPMKHVRSATALPPPPSPPPPSAPRSPPPPRRRRRRVRPLPPSQVPLLTFVFNAGCSSLLLLDSNLFVFCSFTSFFCVPPPVAAVGDRSWSSRRHALMTAPARTWRPRPRMSPRGGYGDTAPPSAERRRRLPHSRWARPQKRMPPCARARPRLATPRGRGRNARARLAHRPDSVTRHTKLTRVACVGLVCESRRALSCKAIS